MRFLSKTPLTIYRKTASDGYLDDDGVWVHNNAEELIPIRCSLQPYTRNAQEESFLPEGIKQEDLRYIFTKTPIRVADDREKIKADETVIDGVRYQCLRVKDFTGYSMRTDHYECVFARKDKL